MKKNYAEKLKDPRWQKKRLEILNRDEWKCRYCQDSKTTLHIHHKSYHGDPWESAEDQLETICEHCHSVIEFIIVHDGKKKEHGYLAGPPYRFLKFRIEGDVFLIDNGCAAIILFRISQGRVTYCESSDQDRFLGNLSHIDKLIDSARKGKY